MARRLLQLIALVPCLLATVQAQQIPSSLTSTSLVPTHLSTSILPSATPSLSPNVSRALASFESVASVLQTALSSSAAGIPSAASQPASQPSRPPHLDTRIDATFGILGGVLIVSGSALGTVGTLYRRPAVFVSGLYSGALVVGLLIVQFALVDRESSPRSITRGLFLLASLVAGVVSGGFCFLFHKAGHLVQSALAGFLLACSLLCVRTDSLIRPVGLRYILLLGLSTFFFVLSCIPRLELPLVLVATSAIGATALVTGIDCFTTAGLKEFYIFNFGFSSLYPKLDGHYTLTSTITIELGVLLTVFICMMAFQHRFYVLMGRKQQTEQENDRERAVRETKVEQRVRKHTDSHLGDWEAKYGNAKLSRSQPENALEKGVSRGAESTKRKSSWFGFGKSHKAPKQDNTASSSTLSLDKQGLGSKHRDAANATSVDFLPRLELEFDQPANPHGLSRPVLAPLQSATRTSPPAIELEGWDDYISTRQIAMAPPSADPVPTRSRSSLALVTPPSSISRSSPRLRDEGDDEEDDNIPLALSPRRPASSLSVTNRSLSSPRIGSTRPSTMYTLQQERTDPAPAAIPRSHSRAQSLVQQIPAVLLEMPKRPSILPRSDSQPGGFDADGRRTTLLDLTEPSRFNPYNERERQRTTSEDRIVTGERRRSMNSLASPKKARETVKIMDFGDLDAKHRKRLSLLQTEAAETVAAETAKARILEQQQQEAAAERRKEQQRRNSSLGSNHILSTPRTSTDEFGIMKAGGGGRPKSVTSLSGLLSLKRNSSAGDLLEHHDLLAQVEAASRPNAFSTPPRPSPDRRQSAQSFASTSKRLSQASLTSPPRNVRRHSLTTLLETSFDEPPVEIPFDQAPAHHRRTSAGVEKVTQWRQSGTLSPARPAEQRRAPLAAPPSPVIEPPTITKKGSKKNSWLDY